MKWLNLGFHFHRTRAFCCQKNWRKLRHITLRHTFISASFISVWSRSAVWWVTMKVSIASRFIYTRVATRDTISNQASRTIWIREIKKIWIRGRRKGIVISELKWRYRVIKFNISCHWLAFGERKRWQTEMNSFNLACSRKKLLRGRIKFARICEFKS